MPEAFRDSPRPADVEAAEVRVAGYPFGIRPDGCGPAADPAITGRPPHAPGPASTPAGSDG